MLVILISPWTLRTPDDEILRDSGIPIGVGITSELCTMVRVLSWSTLMPSLSLCNNSGERSRAETNNNYIITIFAL